MEYIILGVIIIICIGLLVFGIKRKRMDVLLNFVLRMATGTLGIYLVNTILNSLQVGVFVGINTYNILALGMLGTPGFLLLYGVSAYFALKV